MYPKVKKLLKPLIPKKMFRGIANFGHLLEAIVANVRNGFPARSMKFIGVTGTNGKTSTTVMIAAILRAAGYKVGMNTTAVVNDGKKEFENNLDGGLTNAGTFTMQKLLKTMKQNGVEWVAMETASQALDQHRLFGIPFHGAVITNLTNEHLDYHGTMENYAAAKGLLFKAAKKVSVVNADDEWAGYFYEVSRGKRVRYGKKAPEYKITTITSKQKITEVEFSHNDKNYKMKLRVQGEFNAYNALAAISATHELGVDIKTAITALEGLERIPGRMDSVNEGQDFRVLVDYAHTPDAIENVLDAAKAITKGRLFCVTGAAGERPISRRAPVGNIANRIADVLIVTDDEPFGEDPDKIRGEIFQGIKKGSGTAEVHEVADRWDAIKMATEMAKKGDTIVIAGMGHQKYRSGPKGKEKWDDTKIASDILKGKKSNKINDNWREVINNKST